jgi:hypothetical protein
MIKSRRIRWVGHVACMGGNEKCVQNFGWKPGRGYLKDLGVDEKKMSKWILRKCGWGVQIGFIWLRIGTSGRLL